MKVYAYYRNTEFLEDKCQLEVISPRSTSFSKSANELRQTIVRVRGTVDLSILAIGDILLFETIKNPTILAFLKNVKIDDGDNKTAELTVAIGADGMDEEVRVLTSSTQNDIIGVLSSDYFTLHGQMPITITSDGSDGYVRQSDKLLPFGQCIRQLLKQGFREYVTIQEDVVGINVQTKIILSYVKDEKQYEINGEDTIDLILTITPDTYTKYIIFNEEDVSQTFESYLYADGTIGAVPSLVVNPKNIVVGSEKVTLENFDQEYCDDKLQSQSYANSVEMTIDLKGYTQKYILEPYIFNSLGTKVWFYLKNGNRINTNIAEIVITNDIVKLKLGASATRFISKLKEKE